MSTIAFQHGFFVETLWLHPENKQLRERRESPFVLEEGDEVFVPDLQRKQVTVQTGRRHVFRRRGIPEWLCIRLVDAADNPRADLPYILHIEPEIAQKGVTDHDGYVKMPIPPNATRGVLELYDGERYELSLGHLKPADSLAGMRQRLHNLGYHCDDDAPGEFGPATQRALSAFVLAETGEPYKDTPSALADAQGSLRRRHGS